MPILANPRHERFAQALASGKCASEAYVSAGYKPDDGHASRLAGNGKVSERVAELQQRGAIKAEITTESLIAEADEIQRAAMACEQHSAAAGALKLKAVLAGLYIERAENKNETVEHVIGTSPTAAEDWAKDHSATAH